RLARLIVELAPNLRIVQPSLCEQTNAVEYIRQIMSRSVIRTFAFENDAQAILLRHSSKCYPLQLVEQRGELLRLTTVRTPRSELRANFRVLAEHSKNRRTAQSVETFAPLVRVRSAQRIFQQGRKIRIVSDRNSI